MINKRLNQLARTHMPDTNTVGRKLKSLLRFKERKKRKRKKKKPQKTNKQKNRPNLGKEAKQSAR